MRLALFEPDIPQNCGAILRLAACFGVAVDIIDMSLTVLKLTLLLATWCVWLGK